MTEQTAIDQVKLLERYIFGEISADKLDPAIKDLAVRDFSLDATLDKAARARAAIVWTLRQVMPEKQLTEAPDQPNPAAAAHESPEQAKKKSKKKEA